MYNENEAPWPILSFGDKHTKRQISSNLQFRLTLLICLDSSGDDSSEEFPRFLPDSSTPPTPSRPPRLLPGPPQLTAAPQAATAAVMSATPTQIPRYTHIHLPHMACHDYTNKVSYFKAPGGPAKVEVSTTRSRPSPSSQKSTAKPTRSHTVSGGQRKLNNSSRKTTRAYQEDSDYLAHGTGIPR